MQTERHRLEYKAENRYAGAGYPSACSITIYRSLQLVVAKNIDEGQSVTNACEVIATEVVKRYGLDPNRMLFVDRIAEATLSGRTAPKRWRVLRLGYVSLGRATVLES